MALLRRDPAEFEDALAEALADGRRLPRPADRRPFAGGLSCTVLRLVPNGGLVMCGPEGLVEANVIGPDHRALPPLRCSSGGELLFDLATYPAAPRALVALGGDGAPIGTYLHAGSTLDRVFDVRDETSAPVARFEPVPPRDGGGYRLVETGGDVLAVGSTRDIELDGWIDDEWSLTATTADSPLQPMAFVATVLAAKVLFGRIEPVRAPKEGDEETVTTITDLLFGDR